MAFGGGMSGWIKWEKDLKDDPRVKKMARQLRNADVTHNGDTDVTQRFGDGIFVAIVLGGLGQLWVYADSHIRNDDTIELTVDDVNQIIGIKGFAQILPEDWFQILDAETVKLPDFHDHNGTTAKKKALGQKRQAKHREKVTLQSLKSERSSNARVTLTTSPDQDQDLDKTKTENKSKTRAQESAPRETESEIHQHIESIKAKYPKAARADWITAEKLIRNLVLEGTFWELIEAGVERYATHCKATGRMVQNPGLWFGAIDRPWLQDWAIPEKPDRRASEANNDAAWAEAKSLAKEIGFRDPHPMETATSYATAVKLARDTPASLPIAARIGLSGIKRMGRT